MALMYRPILESQSGDFVQPSDAIFVPAKYRDGNGKFLLDESNGGSLPAASRQRQYIATEYEQIDPGQTVLQLLGVEIMNFSRFLEMLRAYVLENIEDYHKRPGSWHSRLAQVLVSMVESDNQVQSIPLIPLSDGKWVAKVDGQCYFATNDSKVLSKLPEGIEDLRIVDESASEDIMRRKLLTKLGVKSLDRAEVCRLLSAFHDSAKGPELQVDALVAHAKYLYEVHRTSAHVAKPIKFWAHDMAGIPQTAASLYLDSPESNARAMSSVLPSECWSSRLLHPSYLKEYKGKQLEKWAKWLESFLGVRSSIRVAGSDNQFTPEFRHLVANLETEVLLDVVLSSSIREAGSFTKIIRDMLGAIDVTCEDGSKVRLNQTCLASSSLKAVAVEGLPFLQLKDSEALKWKKLKELGVSVTPDLYFYLRCMSLIKGTLPSSRTVLVALYKNIEARLHENVEGVR